MVVEHAQRAAGVEVPQIGTAVVRRPEQPTFVAVDREGGQRIARPDEPVQLHAAFGLPEHGLGRPGTQQATVLEVLHQHATALVDASVVREQPLPHAVVRQGVVERIPVATLQAGTALAIVAAFDHRPQGGPK